MLHLRGLYPRRLAEPWRRASSRRSRDDRAMSDIIGTTIVLAVTVVLVGAATLSMTSRPADAGEPPRLDLRADIGAPTVNGVSLLHAGGPDLDMGDLVAVISNGTWSERVAVGAGTWTLGEEIDIPLANPLAAPDRLEINLVSTAHNGVVASALLDVTRGAVGTPPASFTVTVLDPPMGSPATVQAGSQIRVEALVDHSDGRKVVHEVIVDLSAVNGSRATPLYDDGTHGDGIAADLVYSGSLSIPPDAPSSSSPVDLPVIAMDIDGRLSSASDLSAQIRLIVTPSPQQLLSNLTTAENLTLFTTLTNYTNLTTIDPSVFSSLSTFSNISNNLTNITEALQLSMYGPPSISGLTPTTENPFRKITVTGVNFTHVNSVSLLRTDGNATGVAWWVGDDATLYFITPDVGATEQTYRVRVSSPAGEDTSTGSLRVVPLNNTIVSPYTVIGFSPGEGYWNDEVVVTGTNFTFVTSVTLEGESRTYAPAFWVSSMAGEELHFLVPYGSSEGDYDVRVSGPGGYAVANETFHILPPPPPNALSITEFTPIRGIPHTQVTVNGTGFLDSKLVTLGSVSVAYWVVNDTQLKFVTHPGVPTPALVHLKVYNSTGNVTTCCFETMPEPNPREYSIYPKNLMAHAAHNTTKYPGSVSSGDNINSTLKFELIQEQIFMAGQEMHFAYVTMVYAPLKPGDDGRTLILSANQARCAPAMSSNRTGVYAFQWNSTVSSYAKDYSTFRYFYELVWTNGKSGSALTEFRVTVHSTDPTQYFNLRTQDTNKQVLDYDDWPELPPQSFFTCP